MWGVCVWGGGGAGRKDREADDKVEQNLER